MFGSRKFLHAPTHLPATPTALEIVAIVLTVTWLLGLVSGYTGQGIIHVLPVFAAVAVAVRLLQRPPQK